MPSRSTPPRKAAPRKAATPRKASRPAAPADELPLTPDDRKWLAQQNAIANGPTTHDVQSAVEGVPAGTQKITFLGQEFAMAERIGIAPIMLLAVAGEQGADSNDARGLVALHDVIQDCVDVTEHGRFWRHAIDMKADADDLYKVVKDVVAELSARPTRRPGGSSAGSRKTSPSSKASSPRTDTPPPDDGMVSVEDLLGQ